MEIMIEGQELSKTTDKSSLYIQIVERIRHWIIKGYLKDGDVLPSERELAKILGVSRMPVNQALKILEYLGAIQYVRGKGVCVRNLDIHQLLNNIGFLTLDPANSLKNLFEVREAIEVKAAWLAAQRRSNDDLDDIEDPILEMERNILMNKDIENSSLRFHSAIIKASQNDILVKINDFLSELLLFSRKETLNDSNNRDKALDYHKNIFRAIKDKNSESAALLMEKHLKVLATALDT
ncbi:FCD domain-containing protein [Desulfosporosinus sp. FKB]|uniref:FadR/GntR family transcriptional regulator n=1 Tax=Desulfosporosinus sp. FKB TaxID=1969835 RepID=UPI000B49B3C5|nr:FCD domain-containing protein [Desulfosporosinus sp. FKB]